MFCQNSTEPSGSNHSYMGNFCFPCVAIAFTLLAGVRTPKQDILKVNFGTSASTSKFI